MVQLWGIEMPAEKAAVLPSMVIDYQQLLVAADLRQLWVECDPRFLRPGRGVEDVGLIVLMNAETAACELLGHDGSMRHGEHREAMGEDASMSGSARFYFARSTVLALAWLSKRS
jgi:hypothetical protein